MSLIDFDDYELALLCVDKLRRITGDRYELLLIGCRYWTILRYDPSGKEVLWE